MKMHCDDDDDYVNAETKPGSRPFSLRQFVVDARRKDIFQCWPFPKKYLQVCLKYGITNVLPPFEPCINQTTQAMNKNIGQTCSDQQCKDHVSFENKVVLQEKLIKDECYCYYDQMLLSNTPCNESNLSFYHTSDVTVPVTRESSSVQGSNPDVHWRIDMVSPKKTRHKQKKRKGRQKKRLMSDILARATPCTLEDYSIRCNSITLSNDDEEAIDDKLSSKDVRVLTIKFGGCISKTWNIN
ncbi:hypothetical protein GOBAR_AA35659 [Gossypium barbadense]|uniref:Uncharacterized protein n=1 Tax=Gossypium barbadense TaxID=3634 RepID=A0A2P5W1U5_GOSBA|nr:hypothetical protein GOBAR_AA35659 [Gossypium barbadense]